MPESDSNFTSRSFHSRLSLILASPTRRRSLEHLARDDQLLDLRRALVDLRDLRVAEVALDLGLADEAEPPWTCTASVATFIAVSAAKSLAIAASFVYGWPASLRLAAFSVMSRAPSMAVAMSASIQPTIWCSPISTPNALRSHAYLTDRS